MKRFLSLVLIAAFFVLVMATNAFASTTLTVHYFRYGGDYGNWNLWVSPDGIKGDTASFDKKDSYGYTATVNLAEDTKKVFFVLYKGDWQELNKSRKKSVQVVNGKAAIWLVEGDDKIYASAGVADTRPRIMEAFMDAPNIIYVLLSNNIQLGGNLVPDFGVQQEGVGPVPIKSVSNASEIIPPEAIDAGFRVFGKGKKVRFAIAPGTQGLPETATDKEDIYVVGDMNNWCGIADGGKFVPDAAWKLTWNKKEEYYELLKDVGNGQGQVPIGANFQFVRAGQEQSLYPDYNLKVIDYINSTNFVKIKLEKDVDPLKEFTVSHVKFKPSIVSKRGVLTLPQFVYNGDDLGATYTKAKTTFKVWSPAAKFVNLVLYKTNDTPKGKEIPMKRDVNGTWKAEIKGDIKNIYYTYKLSVNGVVNETVDVYAKAVGKNGNRSVVVDLAATNPKGWESHKKPVLNNTEDAIIYELHVRDFTINKNSGAKYNGKYLGFTEAATKGPGGVKTGLDHLKELGVTHVHLMPSFDYATVDEDSTNPEEYNWGYDPKNYNVPEGRYSTNPSDPTSRIREFKEMVKTLHENGIRVVMDVVYNHTYAVKTSWFDLTVPHYYYRTDVTGNYTNGSGCNNETASERAMVSKYIIDSVKYWATEYGVDGFRFDLMALHDINTMTKVGEELRKIDPSILIYGEPWTGGTSGLDPSIMMVKGAQRSKGIAVFNDNIRNSIKGDTDGNTKGFATGQNSASDAVRLGIMGSIDEFADDPGECINYVSAHDNLCLWDKIAKSNPKDSVEDRKRMDKLANAIVLTSEGIPFIHGGEDILRTKKGNHNSYNASDSINNFDWQWKADNLDIFNYYKGLITLRKEHPAFRMTTADDIRNNLEFIDEEPNTIAFTLSNNANGDSWKTIVVVYNPTRDELELPLPAKGEWTVVVDEDEAGVTPVKTGPATFTSKAIIPPISTMVLYQK